MHCRLIYIVPSTYRVKSGKRSIYAYGLSFKSILYLVGLVLINHESYYSYKGLYKGHFTCASFVKNPKAKSLATLCSYCCLNCMYILIFYF